GLESTHTKRRPRAAAAAPVVPDPAKKSRTQSPDRLLAAMIRRRIPRGFCVGYPVFSLPVGETIVCHQTSVGNLPRAAFSAVTRPGAMYGSRSTSAESKWYAAGFLTLTRMVSCCDGHLLFARGP